jgi:hypothetical protein
VRLYLGDLCSSPPASTSRSPTRIEIPPPLEGRIADSLGIDLLGTRLSSIELLEGARALPLAGDSERER